MISLSLLFVAPSTIGYVMWTSVEEEQCLRLIEMQEEEFSKFKFLAWDDPTLGPLSLRAVAGVACRRGHVEVLMMCTRCGLDLSTTKVSPLRVPLLSIAAMFENAHVVQYLLHQGCCLLDADDWGRTPFSCLSSEAKVQAGMVTA